MRLLMVLLLAGVGVSASALTVGAQESGRPQSARVDEDAYRGWQQATDTEEKIALGERLLAKSPALAAAAEISGTIGSLYVTRGPGVRADNIEKAIEHLKAALAVWSRDTAPVPWAAAHNDLGAAYWQRVRGARDDNQESAIAHFEAAQTVFSRQAYAERWAQLSNNLAIVYWSRINGDPDANLERSIALFEDALTVITRESNPLLWAAAQNNLANAFARRVSGDADENREMAIKHLEAALTVFSREQSPNQWAEAQNNLALAHLARTRGDQDKNREQAIAELESALSVFIRETTPQQWAQASQNLGQAYAGRHQGDRVDNRRKAIAGFEAALTVFTRDAAPLDHLRTSRLLGRVLLEAGEWGRAAPVHASAREAFLLLFGQGVSEAERRTLVADAGPLFAEAAYAAIQRGETEAAFELADEGRARLLSVALKLQAFDLPPERQRRLEELRNAVRQAQEAVSASFGTQRAAAIDKLISARRALYAFVETGLRGEKSPLQEAKRLTANGAAVVMPVVTEFGGKLLVMTKGRVGADLTVVDVPGLTPQSLATLLVGDGRDNHGWIGGYFANYLAMDESDGRWSQWISAIDAMGPKLWELFGAKLDATLREHDVKAGARLVWLPPGWLGILPLGLAQDPASKRRFADGYEITYAPSLAALAALDPGSRVRHATLAAVVNPTGDLAGTEREGGLVASYFPPSDRTVLEGPQATADAVLDALKGRTHWHFASHGSFSWLDARNSALIMHNEAPLTVGRLLDTTGLGHPRLVVLSACETGLSDIRNSPDEFIGLPGTFTALGATGVVGTLWPVSDAATALLMAKFYELHLGSGVDPPAALRQAQSWLRSASDSDLDGYATLASRSGRLAGQHLATIEHELSSRPPGKLSRGLGNEPQPRAGAPTQRYAHPYYWAGFIYTGQ